MTDIRELPLIPNPNAPEILVDGFQGVCLADSVIKIDFFSLMPSADGQPQKRLILRLVGGVNSIIGVQQALGQVLEQVAQQMREGAG